MNTKDTQINSNLENHRDTIKQYNKAVKEYLHEHPPMPLEREAIRIFQNTHHRENTSPEKYNKAVDAFNKRHGLLIEKAIDPSLLKLQLVKSYNYINEPYLNRDAIKDTMDNYRCYVVKYNDRIKEKNKEVREYNKSINTDSKKDMLISEFIKANNALFTDEYNSKVEKFNKLHGNILKKRNYQTIKFPAELIFETLIWFYKKQLQIRNRNYKRLAISTRVLRNHLPKIEIDQRRLAKHEINDIQRLGISKKTVQNYIKRLREAKILTDYKYRGHTKGIQLNFSKEILTILDGNPPKSQSSENKSITSVKGKELPDNSDVTRTDLNKEEIKDNFYKIADITNELKLLFNSHSANSYQNTTDVETEKEAKRLAAAKNRNAEKSERLRNKIQDTKELARALKENAYIEHTVIPYHVLQVEVQSGNLTKEEFKKLLVQDLIKQSAKIWKEKTPFVGSWILAIKELEDHLFRTNFIGTNAHFHKEKCLEYLRQYRWQIEFARRWFITSGVQPLYPNDYFDATRTHAKEVGFFGLRNAYKTHQRSTSKKQTKSKQKKRNSNIRKRKISQLRKLQYRVGKLEKGKITKKELYRYTKENLDSHYLEHLDQYIIKFSKNVA